MLRRFLPFCFSLLLCVATAQGTDAERTVQRFIAALDSNQPQEAYATLAPGSRVAGTLEEMILAAQSVKRVTLRKLQTLEETSERVLFYALLDVTPNLQAPGGWNPGINERWLTLVPTAAGWRISDLTSGVLESPAGDVTFLGAVNRFLEAEAPTLAGAVTVAVRGLEGDYARLLVTPDNPEATDPATAYLRFRSGGWEVLTLGTAFSPEDYAAFGIPENLQDVVPLFGDLEPLPAEECSALRSALETTLRVPVTQGTAFLSNYIEGRSGQGCLLEARATGETFTHFIDVAARVGSMMGGRGWLEDLHFLADGPTGTATAYRQGERLALLNIAWRPSDAVTCPEEQPISMCDVPPAEQLYTVRLNTAQTLRFDANINNFPAALNARQVLAQILHLNSSALALADIQAVEWADTCLGLPSGEEACAEVLVPGYRVVFDVNGNLFSFHTDEWGGEIRLAAAPTPETGEVALEWQRQDDFCEAAVIGLTGVATGACDGVMIGGRYATPERQAQLEPLLALYAPFSSTTRAGSLTFYGRGTQEATPAEQRMLAEWAALVSLEAAAGRAGASWGLAFALNREGGVAGFCDGVSVYVTGDVHVGACADEAGATLAQYRLTGAELERLYAWLDTFVPWEILESDPASADSMTVRVVFSGGGLEEASEAERRIIRDYALELMGRLE